MDCHFNKIIFPPLGGEKSVSEERQEITLNECTMSHFDRRTYQCKLEVQMIIHLKNIENQLSYAFINTKKVTKSHIPAANTPARIDVLEEQLTNEFKTRLKCAKPIGSKYITPRNRRKQMSIDSPEEVHDK